MDYDQIRELSTRNTITGLEGSDKEEAVTHV
jgi:hypothetical protein